MVAGKCRRCRLSHIGRGQPLSLRLSFEEKNRSTEMKFVKGRKTNGKEGENQCEALQSFLGSILPGYRHKEKIVKTK